MFKNSIKIEVFGSVFLKKKSILFIVLSVKVLVEVLIYEVKFVVFGK